MTQFARFSDFPSLCNFFGARHEHSFSLLHVNIRSIRRYWNEFLIISRDVSSIIDVFVLTEISISAADTNQFSLPGYTATFYTRCSGRGGGIAVFVNKKWSVSQNPLQFSHAECVALSLGNEATSVYLLAVYRPPSSNVGSFLEELDTCVSDLSLQDQLCIIGDFNIDILRVAKSTVCNYLNTLAKHGIECTIDNPTREEHLLGRLVSSCIDHVNIRTSASIVKSAIVTEKLADHYFVACHCSDGPLLSHTLSNHIRVTRIDNGLFDQLVSAFDWNKFLESVDYSDIYQKFVLVFSQFYQASQKVVYIKKRNPDLLWLNANILAAIRDKNALWARCRRSPSNVQLKSDFKSCRNKVNAMIRSAKRNYYRKKFTEFRSDARKTWSLINEFRGHNGHHSIDDTLKLNFGSNLRPVVENFNAFFATFSGQARDSSTSIDNIVTSSAFLSPIQESDLSSILLSFKPSKSPGIDGIRLCDLRRNYGSLKGVLLFMLNGFLEYQFVPNDLKTSIVRPLYKGGAKNNIENYRPISILPVIAQILEKHVYRIMTSFIDKFNVLSPTQFGFVQGKGTQLLLEDFADKLYSAFDHNLVTSTLFLDVSKAFDTVSHTLLLKKLYSIGFRGSFFSFFENYLCNRFQLVRAGGIQSSRTNLKAGVPQGSILSPLLFNIFVNDIAESVPGCIVYQYADDTLIMSQHINYLDSIRQLQGHATAVMDWFERNLISVNVKKTKLMCFYNPLKTINLSFQFVLHSSACTRCTCVPLEYADSVKYLGLFFDSSLKWHIHIPYICKKLRSASCFLYKSKYLMPLSVRKSVAHALVYSVLRYGITVFGNCSASWKVRIDSLLRGILKSVSYKLQVPEDTTLFNFLELPNCQTLYLHTVTLRHFWSNEFKIASSSSRVLRHEQPFQIPRVRTRYGESTRAYYVPHIFSQLPSELLTVTSLRKLKKRLRSITF